MYKIIYCPIFFVLVSTEIQYIATKTAEKDQYHLFWYFGTSHEVLCCLRKALNNFATYATTLKCIYIK